ncbi:MAG: hypothetical protein R6T90_03275, partial [Dissulfuribacterales bacterium]
MPVYLLSGDLVFPPPELADENGLLAIGGDLSTSRLIWAYRQGIFPWYNPGEPVCWWSPDPRLILMLLSRFTFEPGLSNPRFDFSKVSLIAVTLYVLASLFT